MGFFMLHSYCANFPKNVVMASSTEDGSRIDELMDFLFTSNLLDRYANSSGMDMAQWEATKQVARDIKSAFSCDVENGVFEATTQEQHDALMHHLHRLKKYGLLDKQAASKAMQAVVLKEQAPQLAPACEPAENTQPIPAASPASTPMALPAMSDSTRVKLHEEFIREIKSRYQDGIPLRLGDALPQYCALIGRKPSKDERSRIKVVSDHVGDLFLHEYADTHFLAYKKNQLLKRDTRTLDEQISLVKRIYMKLIEQKLFHGKNPLESWKPSTSAKTRKQKAASSIATIDRIASVFGSTEFAEFGAEHPAYYLIIMTAIVTGMRITSVCRLQSPDLLMTLDGIPVIDIHHRDKSLAGKRQVPIPRELFDALKAFLKAHDGFGIEDRGEKGCSDAIRDFNERFFKKNPKLSSELLKPHGLRSALNNYLLKSGIQMDIRCALLGHALGHVNIRSYSEGMSTPVLVAGLCGIQDKILTGMNFDSNIPLLSGYLTTSNVDTFQHATPHIMQ